MEYKRHTDEKIATKWTWRERKKPISVSHFLFHLEMTRTMVHRISSRFSALSRFLCYISNHRWFRLLGFYFYTFFGLEISIQRFIATFRIRHLIVAHRSFWYHFIPATAKKTAFSLSTFGVFIKSMFEILSIETWKSKISITSRAHHTFTLHINYFSQAIFPVTRQYHWQTIHYIMPLSV